MIITPKTSMITTKSKILGYILNSDSPVSAKNIAEYIDATDIYALALVGSINGFEVISEI